MCVLFPSSFGPLISQTYPLASFLLGFGKSFILTNISGSSNRETPKYSGTYVVFPLIGLFSSAYDLKSFLSTGLLSSCSLNTTL